MFDSNHASFFNESKRIRIIHFILKRKRFSNDPSDDFAFGLDKLIQLEVYSDAYPVHDGTVHEKGRLKVKKRKNKVTKLFPENIYSRLKEKQIVQRMGSIQKMVQIPAIGCNQKIFWCQNWSVFCVVGLFYDDVDIPQHRRHDCLPVWFPQDWG